MFFRKLFAPRGRQRDQHKGEIDFAPILADPKAKNFFGNTDNALNYFDAKASKSAPTSYWASMEKRKTYITNLSAGPTNAFEEQILWTEQGKMWPYPIDNEYLIGKEENVSHSKSPVIYLILFLDQLYGTHFPRSILGQKAYSFAEDRSNCAFYGIGLRWFVEKSIHGVVEKAHAS